ncbi:hypothetical protein [Tabrizicola sp.]|uniref:hypothetical protein n=1 Tax=Tabrizicola sp. TaxID=2005166 RepID=UPI002FDE4C83
MSLAATAAGAQSPQDQMFPGPDSCYARDYGKDHLAEHPAQRVTRIAISPDFDIAQPFLGVHLTLRLRGVPGGEFEAYGSCENEGGDTLYCTMEGDAGAFAITPAKGGAILIKVSSRGMGFENDAGFATLERNTGDDRSFLLRPIACR